MTSFNGTVVKLRSKGEKTIKHPPSKVNIGWARAHFLKFVYFLNFFTCFGKTENLESNGHSLLNINFWWGCFMVFSPFNLSFTVVPLKVAIWLEIIYFWAFQNWLKNGQLPFSSKFDTLNCQLINYSSSTLT